MLIAKIYDEGIAKAQLSSEILTSVPIVRDICEISFSTSDRFYSINFSKPRLNYARRKLTPILSAFTSFDILNSYRIMVSDELRTN